MEWYEVEVDNGRSVKFAEKVLPTECVAVGGRKLGGIIKQGEWAWLAMEATLQVVSLKHGHTVSVFEFAESKGYEQCVIKCVDELFPQNMKGIILAVCLDCLKSPEESLVAFYSVEHCTVLSCVKMKLNVTCCRFVESSVCSRSLMQNFDGCLALGSTEGSVVLLDVGMAKMLDIYLQQNVEDVFNSCHVVEYNLTLGEIHQKYKQCQQDGVHFCLQIEVIDDPCPVRCILPIDLTLSLAIGLEDGRLVLYDLTELQIFFIATPNPTSEMAALVKMDYLEPSDDPRPCFYICSLHEGEGGLTAAVHSVMYERRSRDNNADVCFFETFQTSSVRLTLPLETGKCLALCCQAVSKPAICDQEDPKSLCVLSWYAECDDNNKLLIFDLNQWYKELMPFSVDANESPNYIAAYVLNGQHCALQSFINPATIASFNSIQRCEEHFYPNSLSFDCFLLTENGCLFYNWEGAQNRFINMLKASNATIFLDANQYFNEIRRTRLMPQFCELNPKATFSAQRKYEVILSVALECNCLSLLRDCARCWVDGSFMGGSSASIGITLSTLTDWAWKRATDIKSRCNYLCKSLFEFVGFPLDQREQKELGVISRQLKLLADLLGEVLNFTKRNIPGKAYNDLESKYKSLRMAWEYQELLFWFLNIGLLPEASRFDCNVKPDIELVPYPYRVLQEIYVTKRKFFSKISEHFVSKKTGSCRLIFIDAFIKHECKGNILREFWTEDNGRGLYPPPSIQSMLRIMLVPDMSYDSKCAILLYFFLDLNITINAEAYKSVVANFIKFPSVFKLSASLIKTVQAFWNLDHGHFLLSVDEFLSPFSKNSNYPHWLLELMIESLLIQNASNLALRVLESYSCLISPALKLQTLIANELIPEAFHLARSQKDGKLLEHFFKCCLCNERFDVIRDLALNETESQLVQDILKRNKTESAERLHFIYLLQKSKYLEAIAYMDEKSRSKSAAINTPYVMLSAFSSTVTPVTQSLTDAYFRIKNKIRKKEVDNSQSPLPLSCQLIQQNANELLGGIYHSSALSAHFATYYWGDMKERTKEKSKESVGRLMSTNNAPFLSRPQIGLSAWDLQDKTPISYPKPYKVTKKRTLAESGIHEGSETEKRVHKENPKKRRKVMGDELINDLGPLMNMSKNARRFNTEDFRVPVYQEVGSVRDSNFLTQPPPLSTVSKSHEAVNPDNSVVSKGILKSTTPEPSEQINIRKELPSDEETKNIRFTLPTVEESKEESQIYQNNGQNDQKLIIEDKNDVPIQYETKRTFVRSVSVESTSSASNSLRDQSDENYYSSLSSQNNSIFVENHFNKTNEFEPTQVTNTELNSVVKEGPKARKPIPRALENSDFSFDLEPLKTANCMTMVQPEIVVEGDDYHQTKFRRTDAENDIKTKRGFKSSIQRSDEISGKGPVQRPVESSLQGSVESTVKGTEESLVKNLVQSSPGACVQASVESSVKGSVQRPAESLKLNTVENVSSALGISSVISVASTIKNFEPQVSSSKVCVTQSKFTVLETNQVQAKISENSTVVGGITYMDPAEVEEKGIGLQISESSARKSTTTTAAVELDTTLGMSSYDLTILDTTSVQATKSCLVEKTENTGRSYQTDKTGSKSRSRSEEIKNQGDIYADLDSSSNDEIDPESNVLFDISMGLVDNLDTKYSSDSCKDNDIKPANLIETKESEVIALISSSEDDSIVTVDNEDAELNGSDSTNEHLNEEEGEEEAEEEEVEVGERDAEEEEEHTANEEEIFDVDDDVDCEIENEDEDLNDVNKKSKSSKVLIIDLAEEEKENAMMCEDDYVDVNNVNAASNVESNVDVEYVIGIQKVDETDKIPETNSKHMDATNTVDDEVDIVKLEEKANVHMEHAMEIQKVDETVKIPETNCKNMDEGKHRQKSIKEYDEKEFEIKDSTLVSKSNSSKDMVCQKEQETHHRVIFDAGKHVRVHSESSDQASSINLDPNKDDENDEVQTISLNTSEEILQVQSGKEDEENSSSSTSEQKSVDADDRDGYVEVEKTRKIEKGIEDDLKSRGDSKSVKENIIPQKDKIADNLQKLSTEAEVVIDYQTENCTEIQVDKDMKGKGDELNLIKQETNAEKSSEESATYNEDSLINRKEDLKISVDTCKEKDKSKLQMNTETIASSPLRITRRSLRAESVHAVAKSMNTNIEDLGKKRTLRGASVDTEASSSGSLSSIQEKPVLEEQEKHEERTIRASYQQKSLTSGRIRKRSFTPDVLYSEKDTVGKDEKRASPNARATSVPPSNAAPLVKVTARRRSDLLESTNPDSSLLDSPSTRTRSRTRLASIDSEVAEISLTTMEDLPVAKRIRKRTISSTASEQLMSTPIKRTRRNSQDVISQTQTGTPGRTLCARSVPLVQDEEVKNTPTRRKLKGNAEGNLNEMIIKEVPEEEENSLNVQDKNNGKASKSKASGDASRENSPTSKTEAIIAASSYSTTRRLTRTQLAMMEKTSLSKASAATTMTLIVQNLEGSDQSKVAAPKRVSKRRTSSSTVASTSSQQESDDAESVASQGSNFSSGPGKNRRVTRRSSRKDKDEVDSDPSSVASSVGSKKKLTNRSNESKDLPASHLAVIPEDETSVPSAEPKKHTRRTKQ